MNPKEDKFSGVIFAGGRGTRMGNITDKVPKPLVKLDDNTVLIDLIINELRLLGVDHTYILAGYKKESFFSYFKNDPFVTVVDTGEDTETGLRLYKIMQSLNSTPFILTYGDSVVSHFNYETPEIKNNEWSHLRMSFFEYEIPFGVLENCNQTRRTLLVEKPKIKVNAGFYFLDKRIKSFLNTENYSFEHKILPEILTEYDFSLCEVEKWFPIDTRDSLIKYKERHING